MLDHGQLGPATVVGTPAVSRTPSTSSVRPLTRTIQTPVLNSKSQGIRDSSSMSSIEENSALNVGPSQTSQTDHVPSAATTHILESEGNGAKGPPYVASPPALDTTTPAEDMAIRNSELLGRQLSDAVISTNNGKPTDGNSKSPIELPDTTIQNPPSRFISPSDISAQLFSNPKLAALRDPSLPQSQSNSPNVQTKPPAIVSAPILVNPKCSGYFVEPVCHSNVTYSSDISS